MGGNCSWCDRQHSCVGPSLDYETLKSSLPAGVEPAYDGLTVEAET